MDILTLLLVIIVVVLVVIVVRLRREGSCKCPVDQQWLDEFNKWSAARDKWAGEVQDYLDAFNTCLNEKCADVGAGTNPPEPPPCRFGSC